MRFSRSISAWFFAIASAVSYFRKFWRMLGPTILSGEGRLSRPENTTPKA